MPTDFAEELLGKDLTDYGHGKAMLLLSRGESCGIRVDGIPTAAALRFAPAFAILAIPCRAGVGSATLPDRAGAVS